MKLPVRIARENGNAGNSAAAFICYFELESVARDKHHCFEALQA
jgi:hypothetical protein